ncbi:hypothetical protein EON65_13270 [archaeon]|nr:MAG: hypothetical protein EON65_13270 [archaeon]
MPVRAHTRETCVGSSDTITVPIDEFRQVLDGAVRLARQFDTGLAECGLECDGGILALDKKYDGLYGSSFKKAKTVNTRFPCG